MIPLYGAESVVRLVDPATKTDIVLIGEKHCVGVKHPTGAETVDTFVTSLVATFGFVFIVELDSLTPRVIDRVGSDGIRKSVQSLITTHKHAIQPVNSREAALRHNNTNKSLRKIASRAGLSRLQNAIYTMPDSVFLRHIDPTNPSSLVTKQVSRLARNRSNTYSVPVLQQHVANWWAQYHAFWKTHITPFKRNYNSKGSDVPISLQRKLYTFAQRSIAFTLDANILKQVRVNAAARRSSVVLVGHLHLNALADSLVGSGYILSPLGHRAAGSFC